MRIKEEIIRSGYFSLPSSPEREISGTLSISDGGNVKLELTHPGYTNIKALFGDNTDGYRIFGHVEKDGPVTLDQCRYVTEERSMVHDRWTTSHVIWANRAFIGFSYNEDPGPRFNTVIFSIEGIDEWVGISGIEVDEDLEKWALTISYNQPEEVSLNLHNGMQLLITFVPTFPGLPSAKSAEVSQKTYFKLVSQEERELDEFTSIAEKITAFLCFVMNEIVYFDEVTATSDKLLRNIGGSRAVSIYFPSWPYSKDKPKINESDMLFRFTDRQNRVESVINKWIENYEQIAPALDLSFLTKTRTLPTWNIQFLTLVQALEAYHRRTSDGKEIALRNRIEEMIEPFDYFIDNERRPSLIDSIVKTRNYLTHYDLRLQPKAAKGVGLQFLCRKIDTLFRLHFLKLIGFNKQEINSIVNECLYLKGECNL